MTNLTDREKLPQPLRAEAYTAAIAGALGEAGAGAVQAVESAAAQFAPAAATWGLVAWEHITGIVPDSGAALEERRAAVIAQLCSRGTTNAAAIERLAQALTGYGARVTENAAAYTFILELTHPDGGFVTQDLSTFVAALEAIKPAHLQYQPPSVTWDDLENSGLTWGMLEDTFADWAAFENTIPLHKP